jgi:hypothetical protein
VPTLSAQWPNLIKKPEPRPPIYTGFRTPPQFEPEPVTRVYRTAVTIHRIHI